MSPLPPQPVGTASARPPWYLGYIPIIVLCLAILTYFVPFRAYDDRLYASIYSIVWLTLGTLLIFILHIWVAAILDPANHMVSEYSDVPTYGIWMRAAFFCLAASTTNLGLSLHHIANCAGIGVCLVIAGACSVGMGFFSMRTTDKGMIHTSVQTGMIHSSCASIAFTLAIVTMLLFAIRSPDGAMTSPEWLRAVGLAQFNVSVIVMIIYLILCFGRLKAIRRRTGSSYATLLKTDAHEMHLRTNDTRSDAPVNPEAPRLGAHEKVLTAGTGLGERILIFLFLEWEFVLAFVLMLYAHTK